jgi:hypothetical protein
MDVLAVAIARHIFPGMGHIGQKSAKVMSWLALSDLPSWVTDVDAHLKQESRL